MQSANEHPSQGSQQSSTRSAPAQVDTTRWATAEEEKIRLFTQAQNNARIVQGYAQDLNDSQPSHGRGASHDSSRSFQQSSSGRPPVISAGAALYSHAMASVNKSGWASPGSTPAPKQPPASHASQSSRIPTAAEEKEMLRRYHDATSAVQRHHEANFGPFDVMPTASTSLPPDSSAGSYPGDMDHSYDSAPDELPPPWVPSAEFSQTEAMSEKERYRVAFEARERAAAQQHHQTASPPPSAGPPVSPPADYYTATGTHPDANGSDPRLMVAVDDGHPPPWQAPPPTPPGLPPHLRARSQPLPPSSPGNPGSPRVLSAAEEKAMLKAKYEAEETKSSPPPTPPPKSPSPSTPAKAPTMQTQTPPQTPPPLLPRPPASYIQETAEENARLQDELANGKSSASTNGNGNGHAHTALTRSATGVATAPTSLARRATTLGDDTLGLRPSSPFTIAWDSIAARSSSGTNGFALPSPSASLPPPLPPKVPLEH